MLFKSLSWLDLVLSLAFLPMAQFLILEIEPSIISAKTLTLCIETPGSGPCTWGFAHRITYHLLQVILQLCNLIISLCGPHHQFPPLIPSMALMLPRDNHPPNLNNHKVLLYLLTSLLISPLFQLTSNTFHQTTLRDLFTNLIHSLHLPLPILWDHPFPQSMSFPQLLCHQRHHHTLYYHYWVLRPLHHRRCPFNPFYLGIETLCYWRCLSLPSLIHTHWVSRPSIQHWTISICLI